MSMMLISWLCTQHSTHKDQTTCWCNLVLPSKKKKKADSCGVSGPLPAERRILHYLGQSATTLKSMRAQREGSYKQSEHKKA